MKMPGMLYHLLFGKIVLDGMAVVRNLKIADRKAFMAGNIIPDMSAFKHDAHYYHQPGTDGFYRPDMQLVRRALPTIQDESLRLGVEGHLYLDERFVREFIGERFSYDSCTGLVRSQRTGKVWTLEGFYSPKGLYHGYGECNALLLRDRLITPEWITENMPAELPQTGIFMMDQQGLRSWQKELDYYLDDPPEYTGRILVYGELVDFIRQCAVDFALAEHAA